MGQKIIAQPFESVSRMIVGRIETKADDISYFM